MEASRAFRALGSVKFDSLWTASRQAPFFDGLETGKLSPADFRRQLRAALEVEADDAALDAAWSAMLGPPRQAALSLLAGLRNERQLFLLSNTNLIHLELLRQRHGGSLPWEAHLHQSYYSCDIGARKPTMQAFETVLEAHNLAPHTTLFVDDLAANIAAAEKLDLRTLHLHPGMALEPALAGCGVRQA